MFTHIGDMTDAWLLELRRVLAVKGYACLTFNDTASIALLQNDYIDRDDWKMYKKAVLDSGVDVEDYCSVSIEISPYSRKLQTFLFSEI